MEIAKASSALKDFETKLSSKDPINKALLHQAVLAQLMWRRQKSGNSKTRSEVHGTTKKSLKQKGSGGARHGAKTAPIFVGGGVTHGPKPILAKYKMNKKTFRRAMFESIRARLLEKQVLVVTGDEKATGKTKEVATLLQGQKIKSALLCTKKDSPALRAIRNIAKVKGLAVEGINPYDILNYETLILTNESLKTLSESLEKLPVKRSGASK